jgi:DNA-binding GntR family transcriptional regulator
MADQAYARLEHLLVSLHLAPGSMVSEGDLISLTGFGRTPVREAIQRLAGQELLQVIPRKGLMVTAVSRSGMLQILEVRKPLEHLIAHLAALRASDAQRSALSRSARDLATAHDDFHRFLSIDRTLDALLDDCCGNPFATAAVSPMRSHCCRFWYFHREHVQLSDAILAHAKLARLVARRDYDGASRASDALMGVLERLVTRLDQLT